MLFTLFHWSISDKKANLLLPVLKQEKQIAVFYFLLLNFAAKPKLHEARSAIYPYGS